MHARMHTTTHAYTQTCAYAPWGTPPPTPPTHTPHTCIHTVLGLTHMCSPQILHNSSSFFPTKVPQTLNSKATSIWRRPLDFIFVLYFLGASCLAVLRFIVSLLTAVSSFFMSYDDFFFVLYCLRALFGCAVIYCKSVLTAVSSFFMSYDDFFFVLYFLGASCLAVLRFVLTAVSSFISYDDFLFVLYFLGASCFTVLQYIVSLCWQPFHVFWWFKLNTFISSYQKTCHQRLPARKNIFRESIKDHEMPVTWALQPVRAAQLV